MPRRLTAFAVLVVALSLAGLAASAAADAEALVLHLDNRQEISGRIYNICDMSQEVNSPQFTILNGSFFQQATLTAVDGLDLSHINLSMHEVTQLTGQYDDGTRVSVNGTMNISEHVNFDLAAALNGELVLNSALVATATIHDGIHVQGRGSYPDRNYDATLHLTYTTNLQLSSLVIEYRGGCSA